MSLFSEEENDDKCEVHVSMMHTQQQEDSDGDAIICDCPMSLTEDTKNQLQTSYSIS